MRPVFQTHFDERGTGPGNCMQAAVASLLNLSLDAVPNFFHAADSWGCMRQFLAHYDILMEEVHSVPEGLYFEVGQSTQGHEHVVICKDGRLVHDPNPHGRGIVLRHTLYELKPLTERAKEVLN
jgi:hypothetical protein